MSARERQRSDGDVPSLEAQIVDLSGGHVARITPHGPLFASPPHRTRIERSTLIRRPAHGPDRRPLLQRRPTARNPYPRRGEGGHPRLQRARGQGPGPGEAVPDEHWNDRLLRARHHLAALDRGCVTVRRGLVSVRQAPANLSRVESRGRSGGWCWCCVVGAVCLLFDSQRRFLRLRAGLRRIRWVAQFGGAWLGRAGGRRSCAWWAPEGA